jgi:cyclic pyranopterin phosphate synthase
MVRDTHQRPLGSLRISVTDRCNLRCGYCMPEKDYVWLPRRDLLSFAELATVAGAFADLGVRRVRLTGGEPLLRRDLAVLVGMLAERSAIEDLALTTNGVLLGEQARALAAAGLSRVTISLDSLRPDRFRELTGRAQLGETLRGIEVATGHFPGAVKTNTVIMRGINDDEIVPMLQFGREHGVEVRFIEYMDVGGATRWDSDRVLSQVEIRERIEAAGLGPVRPAAGDRGSAPAGRFALPDGTVFGIIASTTAPFCGACDRARLTADGMLYLCLYARHGLDLRSVVRSGASRDDLRLLLEQTWRRRADRGAEERLRLAERLPLARVEELRGNPHLEMHTRGG